jgi:acetyltransferase-like isoleucine patch superfamily enzyme
VTREKGVIRSLAALYASLRASTRERWRRDLPFDELVFDRWERARSLGFGDGSSVYHNSYIYGDVRVGDHTWIGPFTMLDGSGGLTIGAHCSVSAGVQIYTHDSVRWALSAGEEPYDTAPTSIGDRCYIGASSVVAKGVTVASDCVVGACSFVNRDVPPFTVVAGVPARPIGSVAVRDGKVAIEYVPTYS